jgi:preprotein translocase subunit SecE
MANKIKTYIDEVSEELRTKVSWPTWSELQSSAIVVLIASVITSLIILGMDVSFNWIMSKFYSL